jgi:hypothetical protein
MMKDELRSESKAETGRGGKIRTSPFFARFIFLPSFRWTANRRVQSKPVKVNQTSSPGQAGGPNPCKPLTMNNLRNKQPSSGQTMLNLVNMVKTSQFPHGGATPEP